MSALSKDAQVVEHQDPKQRIEDLKRKIDLQTKWLSELKKEVIDLHSRKPLNQKEIIARRTALVFKEQQVNETQRMINYLQTKVRYFKTIIEN